MPSLLKREINTTGAMLMGLGSIIGTGVFVSIAIATDIAGSSVLIAIILAAFLALFNGLSSAQLAAAHPVSGGTYEYGYHFLNHWFGFTAGWTFLVAKSASAATAILGTVSYSFHMAGISPGPVTHLIAGYVLLLTVTLLVRGGIRQSDRANRWMVLITLIGLLLFAGAAWLTNGLPTTPFGDAMRQMTGDVASITGAGDATGAIGASGPNSTPDTHNSPSSHNTPGASLFYATALMFVAYTGYGRIATLGEEVKNPQKTIPRAIITTMIVVVLLYLLITATVIQLMGAEAFAATLQGEAAPLVMASEILQISWIRWAVSIAAITAMTGVLLNLLLGLSRVLLSMARRSDMPTQFQTIHPSNGSPTKAVWGSFAIIAILLSTGSVQFTWSFSAVTVLIYYAITNLAALRLRGDERRFPAWISLAGLAGCLFLTLWVKAAIWLPAAGVVLAGWVWHAAAIRIARPQNH
jgi:APA family basic amino acid/polyamine antiporter